MKFFLDSCSDIEVIIKNKRPSRSNICSGYFLEGRLNNGSQ